VDSTDTIVRLVEQNQMREEIVFQDRAYERKVWDTYVAPLLELNFYRNRFPTLRSGTMRSESAYAALIGAAFSHARNKREDVLWLLVSQNQGTILNRLSRVREIYLPIIVTTVL
jgi:hypothetical protein